MEEEEKKKGDTEELEKSRNVTVKRYGTVKQTLWSLRHFQTWCAKKDLAIDFKSIPKIPISPSVLCHCEKQER